MGVSAQKCVKISQSSIVLNGDVHEIKISLLSEKIHLTFAIILLNYYCLEFDLLNMSFHR